MNRRNPDFNNQKPLTSNRVPPATRKSSALDALAVNYDYPEESDQQQRPSTDLQTHLVQQEEEIIFVFMLDIAGNPYAVNLITDNGMIRFLVDSGSCATVINDWKFVDNFKLLERPIRIITAAKGAVIYATLVGTMEVETELGVRGAL